jgi:drug/metabolite transporter (DMT)-like permease
LVNILIIYYQSRNNPNVDILKVPKEARLALILRGIFGFGTNITATKALKLIPLGKATVIIYSNPIFVALFGWLILKEKVSNYDIGGILVAFLGVIIFLKNSLISSAD